MNSIDNVQGRTPKHPSYTQHAWQRLRTVCRVLRETEEKVSRLKLEIESKLVSTEKATYREAEVQSTQISVNSLDQQLEIHRRKVLTAKARITQARICKEQTVSDIQAFEDLLSIKKDEVNEKQSVYIGNREQLVRSSAQLVARRRELLTDLQSSVYGVHIMTAPIATDKRDSPAFKCHCKKIYKIANIHIPDAENYAGHNEQEISVGLGYCGHLLLIISRIMDLPLRYPLSFNGSRSALEDKISPRLHEEQRIVRLFIKGQDRVAFDYAVFLLNKDLAQLRCDCLMTTADLRCTLDNLRTLFQHLCGAKMTSIHMPPRPFALLPSSNRSSRSSHSDQSSSKKIPTDSRLFDNASVRSNSPSVVPNRLLFFGPGEKVSLNDRSANSECQKGLGTSLSPSSNQKIFNLKDNDDSTTSTTSGSSASAINSNLEIKDSRFAVKERLTKVA